MFFSIYDVLFINDKHENSSNNSKNKGRNIVNE